MGDMTVHGGTITKGEPTVLIGGQPAARISDLHVCPMQTPAPAPIPHVGMPVAMSSAPTVLIGGIPAACVGDMCPCTGPPDSIAPPGCPTVLIGSGGGGGAGGGPGGAGKGKAGTAQAGAAGASKELGGEEEVEDHFLDVKFVDKGGFPIRGVYYKLKGPGIESEQGPLSGRLRKTGIDPGNYEIELKAIVDAKWSTTEAAVGDEVTLSAQTAGIEAGEKARLTIFLKDTNTPSQPVKRIEAEVQGDKVEARWKLEIKQELVPVQEGRAPQAGYSMPKYYFEVEADGCSAVSYTHLRAHET